MENLVKKINSITTAWIVLALVVLSILAIAVFKLNLSPDFASSRVLIVQIDHEENLTDVQAKADAILKTGQVLKESTGKFYLAFQNVTDEQINDFKTKFAAAQPGVISTGDYNFNYAGEIFIWERLVIVGVVSMLAYLVYTAFNFKGLGLKRIELWPLISVEFFSFAFSLIVLTGVGSLLGQLGVVMDFNYWTTLMLAFAIIAAFRVYTLLRFRDSLKKNPGSNFAVVYKSLFAKYWPEFVFIFCIAIIICVLPLIVIGKTFAVTAILVAVACVLALFNFALLQKHFLQFLNDWDFAPAKKLTSKSTWLKKW